MVESGWTVGLAANEVDRPDRDCHPALEEVWYPTGQAADQMIAFAEALRP